MIWIKYFLASLFPIACLLPPAKAVAADHDIHFWVKAFIPKAHPSLPDYVTKTEAGTYVIPAPQIPVFSQGAGGIPAWSPEVLQYYKSALEKTCFETDNRGFDIDPTVSARITLEYVIQVRGRNISVVPFPGRSLARVGETKNVDCKTGKLLSASQTAPSSDITVGNVKTNGFFKVFFVDASASNPFFNFASLGLPSLALSPKIDFSFTTTFDPIKSKIEVKGSTGTFPSFEAYASIDNGPVQPLMQRDPAEGATVLSLIDFNTGVNTANFSLEIKLR